jgi:hypothetical protein
MSVMLFLFQEQEDIIGHKRRNRNIPHVHCVKAQVRSTLK